MPDISEEHVQEQEQKQKQEDQTTLGYITEQALTVYGFIGKIVQSIRQILSQPLVSEILFISFALIFANRFFWINIQQNGDTNVSLFVGYSLWIWVLFFIAIVIICRLLKYRRDQSL